MLNYSNSSNVSKSQETPKHLEARSWIFRNLQKSAWKTLPRWNFLEILVKHTMKWTESGNCWRLLEGSQLCFIYMLMFHLWGNFSSTWLYLIVTKCWGSGSVKIGVAVAIKRSGFSIYLQLRSLTDGKYIKNIFLRSKNTSAEPIWKRVGTRQP